MAEGYFCMRGAMLAGRGEGAAGGDSSQPRRIHIHADTKNTFLIFLLARAWTWTAWVRDTLDTSIPRPAPYRPAAPECRRGILVPLVEARNNSR